MSEKSDAIAHKIAAVMAQRYLPSLSARQVLTDPEILKELVAAVVDEPEEQKPPVEEPPVEEPPVEEAPDEPDEVEETHSKKRGKRK